jgi:hypothetical protein
MKYFTLLFLGILVLSFSKKDDNVKGKNESSVVLQLFTSQGCSSCPAADTFLEVVKKEFTSKNVIVLSYHIDYWNSLGWKDPFSKKEYTTLQYKYGKQLKAHNIYTPQLVVNGKEHYVGSSKNKILKSIAKNLENTSKNSIIFTDVEKVGNQVEVSFTIDGELSEKKLQLVLVVDYKTTNVKRGENTNRTIANSNIVIETTSKELKAKKGNLKIKIPDTYLHEKNLRIIGFVENNRLQISGATQKEL